LYELGRYQEALPDCEKAVGLQPNDVDSLDSRAFVYKALGRSKDAATDFERILALTDDPDFVQRAQNALEELRTQ
jgi:tetratricopeptide (TPR) repeat protein